MISIDEVSIMLDEIAEQLPPEFYKKLNGGILLLPEAKLHPNDKAGNLYTMGEYHKDGIMGRYIIIYYGSLEKVYGTLLNKEIKEKLKEILLHEFTHHIESLAGERELEIKDAKKMQKYKQQY